MSIKYIYLQSAIEALKANFLSHEDAEFVKRIQTLTNRQFENLYAYKYNRLRSIHQKWIDHIG